MSPARKPLALGLAPRLLAVIAATGACLGLSGLTVSESSGADPTRCYIECLDPARFRLGSTSRRNCMGTRFGGRGFPRLRRPRVARLELRRREPPGQPHAIQK